MEIDVSFNGLSKNVKPNYCRRQSTHRVKNKAFGKKASVEALHASEYQFQSVMIPMPYFEIELFFTQQIFKQTTFWVQ